MPYDVTSPAALRGLVDLAEPPDCVQLGSALRERDYRSLGAWFAEHPRTLLRVYGSDARAVTDLELLRFFPALTRLQVDVEALVSLDGLGHLPDDVEVLVLGATRRRFSLRPLARFVELRRLLVERHTKDLEVVASLPRLRDLTLRSVTRPSLELVQPLRELRVLDLELGGTADLGLLPALDSITHLTLWQVRGLADVGPVAEMAGLECLVLRSLRQVEQLPDLSSATELRLLWLETLKGVGDLGPLRTAPSLEHLALVDLPHLGPDDLRPLRECRSLRTVRVGFGSERRNRLAREALPGLVDPGPEVWDPSAYRFC